MYYVLRTPHKGSYHSGVLQHMIEKHLIYVVSQRHLDRDSLLLGFFLITLHCLIENPMV